MSMDNQPRGPEQSRPGNRSPRSTGVVLYEPHPGVPGSMPEQPAPSSSLDIAGPWTRADWHGIWLASQSRDWRTLAIVPADDGIPTLPVAELLRAISTKRRNDQIGVADLRAVQIQHTNAYLEVVRWHVWHGERVVIALRSCFENPATIPLARSADCAMLCVSVGGTRVSRAAQTIEKIGKERFLGSILVKVSEAPEEDPIVLPKKFF
jgi:hypothetical protein